MTQNRLNELSEKDKLILEIIEMVVDSKMKPMITISKVVGAIVGFCAVTVVVAYVVLSVDVSNKADKDNYISNGNYLRLEKQNSDACVNAIRNPENADLIFKSRMSDIQEEFGFIPRSGTQVN